MQHEENKRKYDNVENYSLNSKDTKDFDAQYQSPGGQQSGGRQSEDQQSGSQQLGGKKEN